MIKAEEDYAGGIDTGPNLFVILFFIGIGVILGLMWLPIIDAQNAAGNATEPSCTNTTIDKYYPCKPIIYTPVLTNR